MYTAIEHYDRCIENATEIYQQCEKARLKRLKEVFTAYCSLERTSLENQTNHLNLLQGAVDMINPETDMNLFISNNTTNTCDSSATSINSNEVQVHKLSKVLGIMDWDVCRRYELCMCG